ncbi:Coiled-coil domain-containing protein 25 [Didymosphaeria variabile]|uniref:Coiled-coil domain-containing protein 25 n=1 Tax=Didymosphaeria variabile TaxID=1932322 RepID=A0A9W8XIB2_9PLEO|nr:Coiled-coil domain-containing protein 25 [Didymosphaeria variabile]KAJ4351795.1 Coiled-coil domain-containing protein 25 [Didymosphaeria variabile]
MVYYFSSNTVSPAAFIYVGKDKVENEELIKYGWDEDVWFHVDNLSSAHIYVRLPEGQDWESIDQGLLVDCAQLTKANSIEGNKKDNIIIVYTPWSNLKKDGSMAVGQVGFKDQRKVKRIHVEKRENPIVNRLNKTKTEKYPDLAMEKEARQKELRKKDRVAQQARKKEEALIMKERKEQKYQKDHAYDDLFTEENMASASNQDRSEDFLDDFF